MTRASVYIRAQQYRARSRLYNLQVLVLSAVNVIAWTTVVLELLD